jgi:hypothetical protein
MQVQERRGMQFYWVRFISGVAAGVLDRIITVRPEGNLYAFVKWILSCRNNRLALVLVIFVQKGFLFFSLASSIHGEFSY